MTTRVSAGRGEQRAGLVSIKTDLLNPDNPGGTVGGTQDQEPRSLTSPVHFWPCCRLPRWPWEGDVAHLGLSCVISARATFGPLAREDLQPCTAGHFIFTVMRKCTQLEGQVETMWAYRSLVPPKRI